MDAREWALILFTILTQMAVGSFITLGIVHGYGARKFGVAEADRLADRALLTIGPVLLLGTIASFFHLGNPANAYRALSNLGSSWLSREILLNLLFLSVGGVFAVMQWRRVGSPTTRNTIAWAAAIIGLVLVGAMSRVYMIRTRPAWDTLATPITFFTTTFLLGALAMGAAAVANYAYLQRKEPGGAGAQCALMRDVLRAVALAAIVLVGVHFVVTPLYLTQLAGASAITSETARVYVEEYGTVFALRLGLAFVGAVILGVFVYIAAASPGREKIVGDLAYVAFALVLIAEVMGRFLFYASRGGLGF